MSASSQAQVNPHHQWPHSLLEVLHAQRAMVDRLVGLAQSQAALIAEGRTDRLLELLAQRQSIIDEFTTSQHRLGELTQGLDQRLDAIAGPDRDRIRALISEIGDRLNQVMQRDEQDQTLLRTSRDQVKQELTTIGVTRQARGAYRPTTQQTTRFADQHG